MTTNEMAARLKEMLEAEFPELTFRTHGNHHEASACAAVEVGESCYRVGIFAVAHCEEDLEGDGNTPLPEDTTFEFHPENPKVKPEYADTPEEILTGLREWADKILEEVSFLRKKA